MKIARPRRRMVFVPTASFGDIAFLLIIFFMVASVFMKEANIKVKPAESPDIDKVKNPPVSIIIDTDGKIWLQGQEYAKDALEPEVSALLLDRTDKQVMLKVDRKQQQKEFGQVLKALSNAGAEIILVGDKKGR
jgi:biopolymer transport protein ExbD